MDNPEARKMVQPSAGIHIILPGYYSPRSMGLLDPATSDGRVIFFLPWLGEDTSLVHYYASFVITMFMLIERKLKKLKF